MEQHLKSKMMKGIANLTSCHRSFHTALVRRPGRAPASFSLVLVVITETRSVREFVARFLSSQNGSEVTYRTGRSESTTAVNYGGRDAGGFWNFA
jgi:hypothetical protein